MTRSRRMLTSLRLWNYNPDNDDVKGDNWNGENFSWFSRSRSLSASELSFEQNSEGLDKGGRILESVVRPYPAKTAGIPVHFEYEMSTGTFTYDWAVPLTGPPPADDVRPSSGSIHFPPVYGHPAITARETEIFVPSMLVKGRRMTMRGLMAEDKYVYDDDRQTLFILVDNLRRGQIYSITVSFDPPHSGFEVNSFWSDFGKWILAVFAALVALLLFSA